MTLYDLNMLITTFVLFYYKYICVPISKKIHACMNLTNVTIMKDVNWHIESMVLRKQITVFQKTHTGAYGQPS